TFLSPGYGQTTEQDAPVQMESQIEERIDQQAGRSGIDSLLLELTEANLREALALIPQLEEQGGRDVLPLFSAMLANALVYDPATRQLYLRTEAGNSVAVRDVFTNETAPETLDVESLERIRLNNRLRGMLRDAIARISLFEGDTVQREAAALNMLGDLNESN